VHNNDQAHGIAKYQPMINSLTALDGMGLVEVHAPHEEMGLRKLVEPI